VNGIVNSKTETKQRNETKRILIEENVKKNTWDGMVRMIQRRYAGTNISNVGHSVCEWKRSHRNSKDSGDKKESGREEDEVSEYKGGLGRDRE
jgi:hypothetical protein